MISVAGQMKLRRFMSDDVFADAYKLLPKLEFLANEIPRYEIQQKINAYDNPITMFALFRPSHFLGNFLTSNIRFSNLLSNLFPLIFLIFCKDDRQLTFLPVSSEHTFV